jgi:lactate dehydrogenase-like 2-hydroxyacid dehydrogenase
MPRLRLVACFSTGYEGIDVQLLQARGIALTTAAGINAHDVADHALALLLAGWSGVVEAHANVSAGRWRNGLPIRRSLRGRNIGIVGFGRIGSAIASRLAPHEVAIAWSGPNAKPAVPYPRCTSVLELAGRSDVLILSSRATPDGRHLVGRPELDALGAEGLLVNVSRGVLVDEQALVEALRDGRLGGAALDVLAEEPPDSARWRDVPRLVLTPHIAGYTRDAGPAMFDRLKENVRRYFAGEPLLTPVW